MYLVKIPNSQTQFWQTKRHKSEIENKNKKFKINKHKLNLKGQTDFYLFLFLFKKNPTAPLYIYTCMYISQSDEFVCWVKTRARKEAVRRERREKLKRKKNCLNFWKELNCWKWFKTRQTNCFIWQLVWQSWIVIPIVIPGKRREKKQQK